MKSKNIFKKNQQGWNWLVYLFPALFFYVIFMAFPLLDSLRLSLYTGNVGQGRTFVGLENFKKLFFDPIISERYWGAFANTWYFFLIHFLFQNCLGILFAVILTNQTMKGRQIYQTIIFIPTTFAVLVTGYLWKLLLNPVWAGDFLVRIGLPFLKQPWLGNTTTALTCVALVSCWQWMGIPTMMFVAALRNISEDCLQAAQLEGANSWQVFWKIKLPLIRPVVGMIAVLTFVNNFNAFDVVFAMENVNGAPGYSTDLIGTLFYRYGIAGQHPIGIPDPGLGAAIATITFFILLVGVIPTLKKTQGGE
ncbi:sugar ABC transporter permease [uncultured Sphaerochaeta sp.]|uniref:carbohydrate ABC transporter permease n=1 Tax=uncultured Sphaerochaeta sp. TaxID=886478 RepID=UPI002A0A686D|nr:sugar ABC transporter permease [uncultured Sphaerochaeta sp.]